MAHPQDHVGGISALPVLTSPHDDALQFYRAFMGFGCDAASLVNVLAHRDATQRALIRQEFKKLYSEGPSKCLSNGADVEVSYFLFEALLTPSAIFKRIFGFLELRADSGFSLGYPQDHIGGTSADVDLELGRPQMEEYIQDLKIVKSGTNDSMLIQLVVVLVGEAFGAALSHALSSSSEPSRIQSLVQAGILMGSGLTVAGIGLHRFKRRLSDNVMKAGAMGTALAIIVAFAGLLPPCLAWPLGAATSTLVATGLAMI